MADNTIDNSRPDEMGKQLKDTLAKRRPRPVRIIAIVLAISVIFLAALAYLLYPTPRTPPLQAIAFDAVVVAGDEPIARAQLYANTTDQEPNFKGKIILLQEQRSAMQVTEKPRAMTLTTDEAGQAFTGWSIGKAPIGEFLASFVDPGKKQASVADRGLLFAWPKDSALLIVAADETLVSNALDAEAGKTLAKANADGWRVVYVCIGTANAIEFTQARMWLRRQAVPIGPVLTRKNLAEDPITASSQRAVLEELKTRFTGTMQVVVAKSETAAISREAGLRTVQIGKADGPADIVYVPSWADVPVRLK